MYNTALTVFFVPYALFEIPSNVVLKILRPSVWISILLFAWGGCFSPKSNLWLRLKKSQVLS